jgi:xanthine dehydrogenase YagR molybdenum-binding subunit
MADGYIGTPVSRIDGHAKVTGAAKYAAEFDAPDLAYGAVVTSTIARGRITAIDTAEAARVAGVRDILTHENRPPLPSDPRAYTDDTAPKGSPFRPLYDDQIWFSAQPVALVVAEDWETARFAASLVRVSYDEESPATDVIRHRDEAIDSGAGKPRGDFARALEAAEVRHEAEYFIPTEHHNPMELYASTVAWHGEGRMTVYDKTQGVQNVQKYLCRIFDIPSGDLSVVSPYVGGAFGSGLRPAYNAMLAVLATRAVERSIRLVLTRQQMYALGYRPATIERLALGARTDGSLAAVSHEAIAATSRFEDFRRNDTGWAELLYTSDNARYAHKLARLDLPTSCDMRAPGAATGVYALESAIDELAVALAIDPLALRLRLYSERDQAENVPYTSKALRECYRQASEVFGWDKRSAAPQSMREGGELVGWGMASGVWEALQVPISVRIALTANGHAEVACATSDIGTGTYTIMAQVAADMLGLPLEAIDIKLGDSTLPQSPVEGGSWIASSVSNAIADTSAVIRAELLAMAQAGSNSPLAGLGAEEVALVDGRIVAKANGNRAMSIADAMRQGGLERIEREQTTRPKRDPSYARNTHSAIFAEVKVDEQLGVIRVTRIVSAIAGGRILNRKTAHSQILGSIVWGIGMALHEETLIDHRFGRMMNANFGEYHVPVNADVHDIEVIFVDEPDSLINPLGVKGLGEIGIVGVAAAIANAVYHATGKRIRDLPITLDKLLD